MSASGSAASVPSTYQASSGPESRARKMPSTHQAAMKSHVMFLASDALRGRDAGSPEYAIAAQYVASQFYEQGLRPAGDNGSYLQTVPLLSYKPSDKGVVSFAPEVRIPADGTISFAGPFRRHDGVVIIDHGHGWLTLLTGVRTDLRKGDSVRRGDLLGRALGPVGVELSTNGTPVSAALIAGSSQMVSNRPNKG